MKLTEQHREPAGGGVVRFLPIYRCNWCGRREVGTTELGDPDVYDTPPEGWVHAAYCCPKCEKEHEDYRR